MENAKESKIPFWEKLPKGSIFTQHYMNKMFLDEVKRDTEKFQRDDKQRFVSIKQELQNQRSLPLKRKSAMVPQIKGL